MDASDYETELTSDIELYDADIANINKVSASLQQHVGKRMNLGHFEQEIIERFGEIGLVARPIMYQAHDEHDPSRRYIVTQITITGRTEALEEFDHDRQQFEVQTNLLNKNQPEVERKTRVSMQGTDDSAFAKTKSGIILPK